MNKKLTILYSIMLILILSACGQTSSNGSNSAQKNKPGSEEP
ncbi:hypothetical protein SRABI133_03048 [Peribacillus simplex]|uniref:Lipoprotein n=2 Tax=Peribacillus simplex TaxID=1478 RepID=A0A9W4L2A5_9BACI|nr:hypothetical protein SRABI133_03048 [Peribacillus simplex]